MPEGPEVKQLSDDLRSRVLNKYLISVLHDGKSKYENEGIPGIGLMIPGNIYFVQHIFTKGKHIFIQLNDCSIKNYIIYIEIRFGEAGRLSIDYTKYCNIALEFCNDIIAGQFTIMIEKFYIYFEDVRKRGAIEIKDINDLNKKLKNLGPDLLSEDVTYELYLKIIKDNIARNPHWQICQYLMNQSKLSGIGNYLKADVLYLCKIRPDRLLSSLTLLDIQNLYYYSITLIKEAYDAGGLTIKNFYTIDGEVGRYKKRIYGKIMDNFGNPVIKTEFKDKRMSHWVPNVQV